jgi:hypothetical protein
MVKRIFATLFAFTFMLSVAPQVSLAQDGEAGREVDPGDNPRERRAQTTMKFLSISLGARASAMGNAAMAQELGAMSMFYNPAGMARLEGVGHASAGQVQWIGDFKYNHVSVAYSPMNGQFGVVGLSFRAGDYGDFIGTVRDTDPDGLGFRETANYSPTTTAIGFGYARALNDQFSIGANVKYAVQDLGSTLMNLEGTTQENRQSTIVGDFGMFYRTGFRSLAFAVTVRNFSRELQYANKQVELPLLFQIGASADVMEIADRTSDMHSLNVTVDATRPRDYQTHVQFGGEYVFMSTLALRVGYKYPQGMEEGINLGGGVNLSVQDVNLSADYAYTQFGRFGTVNRIGLQVGF